MRAHRPRRAIAIHGQCAGLQLQLSFRIVPMPRLLVNTELPLLPNRSRYNVSSASLLLSLLTSMVIVFVVLNQVSVSVLASHRSSSLERRRFFGEKQVHGGQPTAGAAAPPR